MHITVGEVENQAPNIDECFKACLTTDRDTMAHAFSQMAHCCTSLHLSESNFIYLLKIMFRELCQLWELEGQDADPAIKAALEELKPLLESNDITTIISLK